MNVPNSKGIFKSNFNLTKLKELTLFKETFCKIQIYSNYFIVLLWSFQNMCHNLFLCYQLLYTRKNTELVIENIPVFVGNIYCRISRIQKFLLVWKRMPQTLKKPIIGFYMILCIQINWTLNCYTISIILFKNYYSFSAQKCYNKLTLTENNFFKFKQGLAVTVLGHEITQNRF